MVPDSPQMMVCLNTQALLMPPALTCPDWSITMVVSEASAMWLRSTARAAGSKIWERGIINNEGFRPPQNINDEQHNEGINQNKNREEVNYRQIRYLPDLSIVNLLSVFVLVQRILGPVKIKNMQPPPPSYHPHFCSAFCG